MTTHLLVPTEHGHVGSDGLRTANRNARQSPACGSGTSESGTGNSRRSDASLSCKRETLTPPIRFPSKNKILIHENSVSAGNTGECEEVSKLSVYAHQAGKWKTVAADFSERQGADQEPAGTPRSQDLYLCFFILNSFLSILFFIAIASKNRA